MFGPFACRTTLPLNPKPSQVTVLGRVCGSAGFLGGGLRHVKQGRAWE